MAIKAFTALTLALGGPSEAMAQSADQVEKLPMLSGALNQAQLTALLKSHGYTDIKLSAEESDIDKPRRDLRPSENLSAPQAAASAVHLGWNGTAIKNGEDVDIYIAAEAPAKTPRQYPTARDRGQLTVYLDHRQVRAH